MKQKIDTTAVIKLYTFAEQYGINFSNCLISVDTKDWILTINFKDKEEAKSKLPLDDFHLFCKEHSFYGDIIVNEDHSISFRMKTPHNF